MTDPAEALKLQRNAASFFLLAKHRRTIGVLLILMRLLDGLQCGPHLQRFSVAITIPRKL